MRDGRGEDQLLSAGVCGRSQEVVKGCLIDGAGKELFAPKECLCPPESASLVWRHYAPRLKRWIAGGRTQLGSVQGLWK